MKNYPFFFFLLLICGSAFAEVPTEKYVVEKPDGSVVIAYYIPGSHDTLEQFLDSVGLSGLPITPADDIPATREDRKYWKRSGGKVVVDSVKKSTKEAEKAAKDAQKDAVLSKLKISKSELDVLNAK